jgi:predicted amidohydrolase YtcJ
MLLNQWKIDVLKIKDIQVVETIKEGKSVFKMK